MGYLRTPVQVASKPVSDRCKCGHAMLMHAARCAVPGCRCAQFTFHPVKQSFR